jgi:hypothetical protein
VGAFLTVKLANVRNLINIFITLVRAKRPNIRAAKVSLFSKNIINKINMYTLGFNTNLNLTLEFCSRHNSWFKLSYIPYCTIKVRRDLCTDENIWVNTHNNYYIL